MKPEPTGERSVLYAVTAWVLSEAMRDEYVAWLRDGHVQAVMAGGASSARIVALEAPEPGKVAGVETQYVFASADALARYVRDVAPGLRAEGVTKFAARGVRFERRVGEVVGEW